MIKSRTMWVRINIFVLCFALWGCESVAPLYQNDGSYYTMQNNIILKIDTQNRMGQFLDNRLFKLMKNINSDVPIIVKVKLNNGKYSEVRFIDGTVGRIIDTYTAEIKILTKEDYKVLAEESIDVSASKNYSSSKVQIMEATSAAIDQSMLEELANKIFNYLKVKIDNKDFLR